MKPPQGAVSVFILGVFLPEVSVLLPTLCLKQHHFTKHYIFIDLIVVNQGSTL